MDPHVCMLSNLLNPWVFKLDECALPFSSQLKVLEGCEEFNFESMHTEITKGWRDTARGSSSNLHTYLLGWSARVHT